MLVPTESAHGEEAGGAAPAPGVHDHRQNQQRADERGGRRKPHGRDPGQPPCHSRGIAANRAHPERQPDEQADGQRNPEQGETGHRGGLQRLGHRLLGDRHHAEVQAKNASEILRVCRRRGRPGLMRGEERISEALRPSRKVDKGEGEGWPGARPAGGSAAFPTLEGSGLCPQKPMHGRLFTAEAECFAAVPG